jgi:TPR repeat protein
MTKTKRTLMELAILIVIMMVLSLTAGFPGTRTSWGGQWMVYGADSQQVLQKGIEYFQNEDYQSALEYFGQAAAANNADAMFSLGWIYQFGKGVEQDYLEAVRWYQKGAEAGSVIAMESLGGMYEHGYGVAKDLEKAIY